MLSMRKANLHLNTDNTDARINVSITSISNAFRYSSGTVSVTPCEWVDGILLLFCKIAIISHFRLASNSHLPRSLVSFMVSRQTAQSEDD